MPTETPDSNMARASVDRTVTPRIEDHALIGDLHTAALVTNTGRAAWFVGVLVLFVYAIFAMTLYLLPPKVQ